MPLGARVPTVNPRPWEYDDSLPEPGAETWRRIEMTLLRHDGTPVDIEFLRPQSWINDSRVAVGGFYPVDLPELGIKGLAAIHRIESSPIIAAGEGSVVTGRFVTREVTQLCELTIANSGGETEMLRGTPIHPFWSVDRQDWVAMEDLVPGERLRGGDGPCTVVANRPAVHPTSVYNLEIHGHHVYQVGEFGLLVHNACSSTSGNNAAAAIGRQMHVQYKAGLHNGVTMWKEFNIPDTLRRIDFLDTANGIIYELKPDNPRAIARGLRQAEHYRELLLNIPEYANTNWRIVIDVY